MGPGGPPPPPEPQFPHLWPGAVGVRPGLGSTTGPWKALSPPRRVWGAAAPVTPPVPRMQDPPPRWHGGSRPGEPARGRGGPRRGQAGACGAGTHTHTHPGTPPEIPGTPHPRGDPAAVIRLHRSRLPALPAMGAGPITSGARRLRVSYCLLCTSIKTVATNREADFGWFPPTRKSASSASEVCQSISGRRQAELAPISQPRCQSEICPPIGSPLPSVTSEVRSHWRSRHSITSSIAQRSCPSSGRAAADWPAIKHLASCWPQRRQAG